MELTIINANIHYRQANLFEDTQQTNKKLSKTVSANKYCILECDHGISNNSNNVSGYINVTSIESSMFQQQTVAILRDKIC